VTGAQILHNEVVEDGCLRKIVCPVTRLLNAHYHPAFGIGRRLIPGRINITDMPETTYQIRVKSALDEKWTTYFFPFSLIPGDDETLLTGVVVDQAELFGILLKVRDLGLHLISVNPVPRK
jgi:hypothetical protein